MIPLFDYGDTLYHCAPQENLNQLQVIQNEFARNILRVPPWESAVLIRNQLKIMKLANRRLLHFAALVYKTMKGLVPEYLSSKFQLVPEDRGRVTRAQTHQCCYIKQDMPFRYGQPNCGTNCQLSSEKQHRSVAHLKIFMLN